MGEFEFMWVLRTICQHDAYPELNGLLCTMGEDLGELSEETATVLRAYFEGPHGKQALVDMENGADRWDVSEVHVDPQV